MVQPDPPEFQALLQNLPVSPFTLLGLLRDAYHQSPDQMEKAKITSVKHMKTPGTLQHEFVLVTISHDDYPQRVLCVRIDRSGNKNGEEADRQQPKASKDISSSSPSPSPSNREITANDTLKGSTTLDLLLNPWKEEDLTQLACVVPSSYAIPLWRLVDFLAFLNKWSPSYELLNTNCYYHSRIVFSFLVEKAGQSLSDLQAKSGSTDRLGKFWGLRIFKEKKMLPEDLAEQLDISGREFLKVVYATVAAEERANTAEQNKAKEVDARVAAEERANAAEQKMVEQFDEIKRLRAKLAALEAGNPSLVASSPQ